MEKDQFVQSAAGDRKRMSYIIHAYTTNADTRLYSLCVPTCIPLPIQVKATCGCVLTSVCLCVSNVLHACIYVLAFFMI